MTATPLDGRLSSPRSASGLAVSTVGLVALAAVYWWYGIVESPVTLRTIAVEQYVLGCVLGASLTAGYLAILSRPALRERCAKQLRRVTVVLAVGLGLGLLVAFAPVVLSLGTVVLAFGATVGRTILYINP